MNATCVMGILGVGFESMRLLLLACFGLLAPCCEEDHSRDQWMPRQATGWHVTPGGHTRDSGPFASVAGGWTTDAQIDDYVDRGFQTFTADFPELVTPNTPIILQDDYVMWAPGAGTWAAGMTYGPGYPNVWVCLWYRIETPTDPGPAFIVRSPAQSWGTVYTVWRHTGLPLTAALTHELLHMVIDDPNHTSPLWSRVTFPAKSINGAVVTCSRASP